MQKSKIWLRFLFFLILSLVLLNTNAQTGLNFQGVARTSNNVILASQAITIKLSILQGSATGTADYIETRKVTTNAQGLFTAVIGDTGAISTIGNFTTINWKLTPKFLKIEMDPAAGTNFIMMGTTQFQYVAYAQFAKSVDAENIVGIVPVTLGGTGVNSLTGLKTALTLNNVNNTLDLNKPISTLTQTALDLKLNTADTSKYTKQKYIDSSLLTKLKISDTAAMLSSRIASDTLNLSNRINLKANTADVNLGLALKENISNKSTAVDLGGTTPSDVLFPTQKAVKDYVAANNSGGGVADGGITTIKLADGAVTDAKINTVSGSKVIGNITGNAATATLATNATTAGNITATSNTTLTTLSNLTSVGTITTGTWSGTEVAITNGGTGATTAASVRSNLGLGNVENTSDANKLVSTATQTALDLKLNSTGNAATATKLAATKNINGVAFDGSEDITITSTVDAGSLTGITLKSTITGSSLTSVGTIVSLTTGSITNSGKVIIGASSAASASAVVEVNSTTQGFLPPRMNYYQKTQISSPVAGLTIWCSNCGVSGEMQVFNGGAWTNMSGGTATGIISLSVGDSYQGGKVAYILGASDPGYDVNTQHGLIAATSDQSSGITWYNGTYKITGATGTAIGTGLANTNTIIASQGATTTSYAAGLARAHNGGGYTDWYLPSTDELYRLYLNRITIGGFSSYAYWSSTEADSSFAWYLSLYDGIRNDHVKSSTYRVRAIRAF